MVLTIPSSDRRFGRKSIAFALALQAMCLVTACERKPLFFYDFEREEAIDEPGWNCRTMLRISNQHATSGSRSLEVEFFPDRTGSGESYPGLYFVDFDTDWRGYRRIVFDVHNPGDMPVLLHARIDDRDDPPYENRFQASMKITQGDNHVVLPFGDLVTSGTRRPLNLGGVAKVVLFLDNPAERKVLYFDRIHLE